MQREEELVDDRSLFILAVIVLHAAHIRQERRNVQKLARVEHTVALGAPQRLCHGSHAAERRAAAQGDHLARRVGLVEQAVHPAKVIRGREPPRAGLGVGAHGMALQPLQKARQLQHANGFFKQFTHSFLRKFDSDS